MPKTSKMDPPNDFESLAKAISGFGVDEDSMILILGKWHSEQLKSFRKRTPQFFSEDERLFERLNDNQIAFLTKEVLRFKNAVVQLTMHPWERDARLAHEAVRKEGPQAYSLLIEIACTRSSEELLGARIAYQSLFDQSIEDVASRIECMERKLLVALVSSYRYEGAQVSDSTARSEARTIGIAIKSNKKNLIEDDKIVRILTIRSKLHLKAVVKFYKEIYGRDIYEDLESVMSLKETIQCLCHPQTYFSKVLIDAFKDDANDDTKEALTRVIVTRNNVDMKEIVEEFDKQYGVPLSKKIKEVALGNYKDFLVSLINRNSYHEVLIN